MVLRIKFGKQPLAGLFFFGLYTLIFLIFLALPCPLALGGPTEQTASSIEESVFSKWLILNYYQKTLGGFKSEIINPDFFLSPQGQVDPEAEFFAFQEAIRSYLKKSDNPELLCRYPARLTLFINSFDWVKQDDRPRCADYINHRRPHKIISLSLVFASGYFDNPGSMYGHTLLKFNYAEDMPLPITLNTSLGYGAHVTTSEMSLLYVIYGLFGGFEASYQSNNHFIYGYFYTNKEIRDLWEYELNLTSQQIEFIAEHSWEMRRAKFKYYFFNDNCAHRIARILELATNLDLSKSHGFWLLPLQVFHNLGEENKKNSFNLVKQSKYHPSLKSTFSENYNKLNEREKFEFERFFELTEEEKRKTVKSLDTKILILILNYLDLQVAKQTIKSEDKDTLVALESQRAIVLSGLLRHPTESIKKLEETEVQPDYLLTSQPASFLRLSLGAREEHEFFRFKYRVANNDFLNPPIPGQEISKFLMGEFEIEGAEDEINFTRAVAIDIVNLNTNPLPIWMTKEFSWGFKIDYAPKNNLCAECSTFGVQGQLGKAGRINSKILLYGLTGPRLNTRKKNHRDIFSLVSEAGAIINVTGRSILLLTVGHNYDTVSGDGDYLLKANLALNWSKDFDTRMSIESDGNDAAALVSVGYYFD